MYDLDEDGYLGKAECLYLIESMYRCIGDIVQFPENESNAEKRVEVLFQQMDLDQDGRLSFQEFQVGCLSDSSIMNGFNLYQGLLTPD